MEGMKVLETESKRKINHYYEILKVLVRGVAREKPDLLEKNLGAIK